MNLLGVVQFLCFFIPLQLTKSPKIQWFYTICSGYIPMDIMEPILL